MRRRKRDVGETDREGQKGKKGAKEDGEEGYV